jgi:hypothetical protein
MPPVCRPRPGTASRFLQIDCEDQARLMTDPDPALRTRVFEAMMQMKRLKIVELERAAAG